MDPWVVGTLIK